MRRGYIKYMKNNTKLKENILKCVICGKKLKKIDKYIYRGNCEHFNKNTRVSVG